jgi:N-acylneuraminate cytidylyltransferase
MNLAIIPARGGSKRIKNKNIIDFCGRPIIAYSLDCARQSGLFDKIHVSTDSPEIAEVAEQLGYPVDFPRTADLADDMTPLMPVIQWVVQQYVARGEG